MNEVRLNRNLEMFNSVSMLEDLTYGFYTICRIKQVEKK